MPPLSRRLVAEALGTFGLVFIGAAVVVVNGGFPQSGIGLLGIALAHAVVLSVMISSTMTISGGHLNPAVTLGLLTARRIDLRSAAAYILVQLVAACIAAYLVKLLLPSAAVRTSMVGVPVIASSVSLGQAIGLELVLTFFLVSAVFGTAVSPDAPRIAGFGIGLVLLFDILVGGPLTGAAMNPARAFGPALASGQWVGHLVYWIGPLAGGVLAALLWEYVLLPRGPHRRRTSDLKA
ncbi:MAG TPA: aquaporin [Gemmatimonadales bacterium]|nr:aquaporin [Gemmatimonadales bacterium]